MKYPFAAAVILLSVCSTVATAQEATAQSQTLGTWRAIDVNEDVNAAAAFAAAEIGGPDAEIMSLSSAEMNLDGGLNYRIIMNLADGQYVKATVLKQSDGTMTLTEVVLPPMEGKESE